MPANYGTGAYGTNNYSAPTNVTLACSNGSFTVVGGFANLVWNALVASVCGLFSSVGEPAGYNVAMSASTGIFSAALNTAGFVIGKVWAVAANAAATWTSTTAPTATWNRQSQSNPNWTRLIDG